MNEDKLLTVRGCIDVGIPETTICYIQQCSMLLPCALLLCLRAAPLLVIGKLLPMGRGSRPSQVQLGLRKDVLNRTSTSRFMYPNTGQEQASRQQVHIMTNCWDAQVRRQLTPASADWCIEKYDNDGDMHCAWVQHSREPLALGASGILGAKRLCCVPSCY